MAASSTIKLREHQEETMYAALPILRLYKLLLLWMEIRTGKTHTALSIAQKYGAKNVLFITKKKAIGSIKGDYKAGGYTFNIEVINHESVHKRANLDYDIAIIDECHALGAFPKPTKRTLEVRQAVYDLPVIYLSGTPTPESFSQFYHMLYVSRYSPFSQYKSFYAWAKAGFVNIRQIYLQGAMRNDYNEANISLIDAHIRKHVISVTQEEAGFSCPVEEEVMIVPMLSETRKLFTTLRKEKVITINDEDILADSPGAMLMKLSQLAGGTLKGAKGHYILDKSKAFFIQRKFYGKKIAIFYRFIAEFEVLKEAFPAWTDDPEVFAASTSYTFLCQIQSGREGITLKSADYLVFYNIDFSATSYWQARGRMQDYERKQAAQLYWIFSDLEFETKVLQTVQGKKNFTYSHYRKFDQV